MEIIFHNVQVVIEAETPGDAYTRLCNAMQHLGASRYTLTTDTFTVRLAKDPQLETAPQSTKSLWPE